MYSVNGRTLTELLDEWNQVVDNPDQRYADWLNNEGHKIVPALHPVSDEQPINYLSGKTQLGKTPYKFHLAHFAHRQNYADVTLIITMNTIEACNQLHSRAVKFFPFTLNRTRCQTVNSLKSSPVDHNSLWIGQANTTQIPAAIKGLRQFLDTERMLQESMDIQLNKIRLLTILDEGDIMDPGAGTLPKSAIRDRELFELIFALQDEYDDILEILPIWKVSATLASTKVDHQTNMLDYYEALNRDRMFWLPEPPDYVGINTANTNHWGREIQFRGILNQEDAKTLSCRDLTRVQNSMEYLKITDALVEHAKSPADNPFQLPVVANVTLARFTIGHMNLAKTFQRNLVMQGYNAVFLKDTNDYTDSTLLNSNTDIAILLHNGTTDSIKYPIKRKLELIAKHGEGKVWLVIVVCKNLGGRSITFDTGNYDKLYDRSSNECGMYCNATVLMPNPKENIEAIVQEVRATGTRPPLKEHIVITTPEVKQLLQNEYYQIERALNAQLDPTDPKKGIYIPDNMAGHSFGPKNRDKRTNRIVSPSLENMDLAQYNKEFIAGNTIDCYVRINEDTYNEIKADRDLERALNLCIDKGYEPLVHKVENGRMTGAYDIANGSIQRFNMAAQSIQTVKRSPSDKVGLRDHTSIRTFKDRVGNCWIYAISDPRYYTRPYVRLMPAKFPNGKIYWRPRRLLPNAGDRVIATKQP